MPQQMFPLTDAQLNGRELAGINRYLHPCRAVDGLDHDGSYPHLAGTRAPANGRSTRKEKPLMPKRAVHPAIARAYASRQFDADEPLFVSLKKSSAQYKLGIRRTIPLGNPMLVAKWHGMAKWQWHGMAIRSP